MQEDLVEQLRVGPGEAARHEIAVGECGPTPRRWTLRTMRVAVEWLRADTLSGSWRVWDACGLPVRTARAQRVSPAPEYPRKGRRLPRGLPQAARHPDTVVALCRDDFSYPRWPEVAPTWGADVAVAPRAGNPQPWRTMGALNALTGQVASLAGYLVGRPQGSEFYAPLDRVYPEGALLYVIPDHGNIPTHPAVWEAWAAHPRISPIWLPTYAPWLNPLEKLGRWGRQDVLKMPRGVEDWPQVKPRVRHFLAQFAHGWQELLRYVGLLGKGKLATVINTS